jgi:hypothetical protein
MNLNKRAKWDSTDEKVKSERGMKTGKGTKQMKKEGWLMVLTVGGLAEEYGDDWQGLSR